jgi:DNA-binding transcriptional MerR regulator/methylmalonyl-CoA mutase cobalamin-binding subunit
VPTEPNQLMSIGALARATGVPADTLRTWERRYGFPLPERTDTGHRRYSLRTLERLRLVTRALELGHRPSTVLAADEATLHEWLAVGEAPKPAAEPVSLPTADDRVARWIEHVERYEGRALERELRVAASDLGGLPFMEQAVGPFLREIGKRWAHGALGVRHEHFATERVREFLVGQWRPLSDTATGSLVVCATPAGELHVLGLHMAAFALALHNARIVFLGASVPAREIAEAVLHHGAQAAVLSAASGVDRTQLQHEISALRAALPPEIVIVAGGRGFLPPPGDVVVVQNLFELVDWYSNQD